MAEATARPRQRYPLVPRGKLQSVVSASYREHDNDKIRSFVAILVEKQASEQLSH